MEKNVWNKNIFILSIAIIVGILTMLHVIVGYAKSPHGARYLWTGHYYLDYFYYLTPIAQGERGALISYQQGATDDGTVYPHLWPYIIIGQIGRMLNLTPVTAFWLSVFLFSTVTVVLISITIKKILNRESFWLQTATLFLALSAGPFWLVNGGTIKTNDFWYSTSTFFRRFEPIPHHLLSTIFILLGFIIFSDLIEKRSDLKISNWLKKTFLMTVLFTGVLSFNSYSVVVPFLAILLTGIFYIFLTSCKQTKRSAVKLFFALTVCSIVLVAVAMAIKMFYEKTTFLGAFKNTESILHQSPGLKTFFLTFGPLFTLSFFGIKKFFSRFNVLKFIFLLSFIVSISLYNSSFDKIIGTHNGRFLTPLNYILLASLSILGIKQIGEYLGRVKKLFIAVAVFGLLFYSIPIHFQAFQLITNDQNISSPISYLPSGIIDGFKMLDKFSEKGNVLITPSQFLGTVIPVYSGRKTYVARQIVTPNYIDKNIRTSNFYLGAMSKDEAYDFLKKNDLKFVVLTSIEGYDIRPLYQYPFLKEIYKNKEIVIFELT